MFHAFQIFLIETKYSTFGSVIHPICVPTCPGPLTSKVKEIFCIVKGGRITGNINIRKNILK